MFPRKQIAFEQTPYELTETGQAHYLIANIGSFMDGASGKMSFRKQILQKLEMTES